MSNRANRRVRFARLFTAAATAAGLLAVDQPSYAANVIWAGTIGDWTVGSNWDTGTPPNSATADIAFINNGGTAQIDSTMAITTGSLSLGSNVGHVGNLTMSGGSLTTTNTDIRIGGHTSGGGGTGTFTQTGGQVLLNAGNLNLGFGSNGASGTYNLSNGSLRVVSANIIAVGNRGVGVVNQVSGDVYIQNQSNQAAGSLLNLGRNTTAFNSNGTYNLSGGTVTAQTLQYGNAISTAAGSVNTFSLSGTGKLIVNDIKIVNTNAVNNFNMTGGTLIANQITIPLNNQGGTLSPAFVAFSTASTSGASITPIGTTTFVGDNSYTQGPAGTLAIELAGPGSFDVLSIGAAGNGSATLAGTMAVSTLAGYDPAIGTTFDVLLADTITGTLVPTGLTPSGNAYAASQVTAGDGRQALRLTVVAAPEPGSVALAGVALTSFAFRRRIRRRT